MLDLEVQPERSLGNEQWEFVLGESPKIKTTSFVLDTDTGTRNVCFDRRFTSFLSSSIMFGIITCIVLSPHMFLMHVVSNSTQCDNFPSFKTDDRQKGQTRVKVVGNLESADVNKERSSASSKQLVT